MHDTVGVVQEQCFKYAFNSISWIQVLQGRAVARVVAMAFNSISWIPHTGYG